ncbi:MAG: peptidylprolyl isomerase [Haliscomenobacter sp.]
MIRPAIGWAVGLSLLLSACIPPREEEVITEVRYDVLDEPEFQAIYTLQDKALSDSLYPYLRDPDPTWRRMAALAFASTRDSQGIDSLVLLLSDPIGPVREAAAYALGQIGSAKAEPALIAAFDGYDSLGRYAGANGAILEAVGKCGSAPTLEYLSQIRSYLPGDTALLLGQVRGIYRFGTRGISSSTSVRKMAEMATKPVLPRTVRLVAAHYLSRTQGIVLDSFTRDLSQRIPHETDPSIRMALVSALSKSHLPAAQDSLLSWILSEPDYRVKVNIIRALAPFDYTRSRPFIVLALHNENEHIALQAAQFFRDYGNAADASYYWKSSRDTTIYPPVKAMLLAAAQRHVPQSRDTLRFKINADNRSRFQYAQKTYNKVAYLRALGENPWNYRWLFKVWSEEKNVAIRTTAAEAIASLSSRADFEKQYGSQKVVAEFAGIFKLMLKSKDAGSMAVAAGALRHPSRNYRMLFDSLGFLDTALSTLVLPKDQETYQEIQHTYSFLQKGKQVSASPPPAYNHPINWSVLRSLPPHPVAVLLTSKGRIEMELLPSQAPGTVISFVQLARDGYYAGKSFHRVVPNFVIQGGCPRGDGYGSLDFTIRSELSPAYYDQEGYVGMASAGNHTEGVQFFITHSPTPHLDGNYTIFGRVRSGMEVVHRIQPGDIIEKVIINP